MALQQHFLDQTQAQGEPVVEPDRMGDDLRRETMALVADGRHCHAAVPKLQMLTRGLRDNTVCGVGGCILRD